MTERIPIDTTYVGEPGKTPIAWSAVRAALAAPHGGEEAIFLGTVRPNGKPHVVGIGISWIDGDLWFTTFPDSVKAANLAANPHCTIAGRIGEFDLSIEGVAEHIVDPALLESMAARFREEGWPATVNGEFLEAAINELTDVVSRWNLYRFRISKVIALGHDGLSTTTWRFAE